jgi:hypothetical protein
MFQINGIYKRVAHIFVLYKWSLNVTALQIFYLKISVITMQV